MASLAATLCLNHFFLPPTGTLTIQEPSNWVALVCFLAASTLVSRLVTQARKEAGEAQGRQRELEILGESGRRSSYDLDRHRARCAGPGPHRGHGPRTRAVAGRPFAPR